jgi:predicted nucleic acid-binding protein
MECYGEMKAELQRGRICVADLDLMMGATALTMGYSVVTNNVEHFSRLPGLRVLTWH